MRWEAPEREGTRWDIGVNNITGYCIENRWMEGKGRRKKPVNLKVIALIKCKK